MMDASEDKSFTQKIFPESTPDECDCLSCKHPNKDCLEILTLMHTEKKRCGTSSWNAGPGLGCGCVPIYDCGKEGCESCAYNETLKPKQKLTWEHFGRIKCATKEYVDRKPGPSILFGTGGGPSAEYSIGVDVTEKTNKMHRRSLIKSLTREICESIKQLYLNSKLVYKDTDEHPYPSLSNMVTTRELDRLYEKVCSLIGEISLKDFENQNDPIIELIDSIWYFYEIYGDDVKKWGFAAKVISYYDRCVKEQLL